MEKDSSVKGVSKAVRKKYVFFVLFFSIKYAVLSCVPAFINSFALCINSSTCIYRGLQTHKSSNCFSN